MNRISNPMPLATRSPDGWRWLLRRNGSITPKQWLGLYFSLCGLSLSVAFFLWWLGAMLVLPFTLLEILALGVAFGVHARHATDQERISVGECSLVVEQECAGEARRSEFARHWVQVITHLDGDRLVEVRGGGCSVRVGRYLAPHLRPALAREIRRALQDGG